MIINQVNYDKVWQQTKDPKALNNTINLISSHIFAANRHLD